MQTIPISANPAALAALVRKIESFLPRSWKNVQVHFPFSPGYSEEWFHYRRRMALDVLASKVQHDAPASRPEELDGLLWTNGILTLGSSDRVFTCVEQYEGKALLS